LDIITGLILGALQGATEFLPISSSGHLVFAENILGNKASAGLVFEVFVHTGTMASVLIYFKKKIWQMIKSLFPPYTSDKMPLLKLAGIIVIGTIPAVIIGLAFEHYIEQAFNSVCLTSLMLIVTAMVLLSTRLIKAGKLEIGLIGGFLVGIAQSMALLPGISRSGMTISTGLFLKVAPAQAAEFSFLLSLPAVFGATLLKTIKLSSAPPSGNTFGIYLVGAICAFFIGYLAIAWLMRIVKTGRFFYFGIYCLAIGVAGLLFL
jgi:undecaprenyl-diphosphatase